MIFHLTIYVAINCLCIRWLQILFSIYLSIWLINDYLSIQLSYYLSISLAILYPKFSQQLFIYHPHFLSNYLSIYLATVCLIIVWVISRVSGQILTSFLLPNEDKYTGLKICIKNIYSNKLHPLLCPYSIRRGR